MVALETKKLKKKFGGLIVTDSLDFCIYEGELRCLIGPNGAGKTTFFNLLTGHITPDNGRVIFYNTDITKEGIAERARLGIGRKFQTPTIFDELTVYDNVCVAIRGKSSTLSLFVKKYDFNFEEEVRTILKKVKLYDKMNWPASVLSHGERQWLEISMVLANNPKLLLLDEPTAGMTPSETKNTVKMLQEIAADVSTIVIEHDLKFVKEIATKITVLHKGAILMEGSLREISGSDEVRRVYLGRGEL